MIVTPLALLMSIIALWKDKPKHWAIAGFIISLLAVWIIIYFSFFA
jgi:hypothetical protein